jgi:hypothetical protein
MIDVSPNDGTTVLKHVVHINKLRTSHSQRCVTAYRTGEYDSKLCFTMRYFSHASSGTEN